MIGLRTGLALGLRTGAAVGIGADAIKVSTGGTSTSQTVTVVDSADPVITGGDAFSYTVQYTNTGGVNATNVSMAVTLDASLAYVSASGTGWSIGQSAGVVTCTQASIAPGAANAITINVTTGTSALTASTSAAATADNATTANGSQGTTVQLVTKDATAGKYAPASSTEWANFIARKGLAISAPASAWLCNEASGNLADSIGAVTLTKAGTPAYQQAVSGWSRTGVLLHDAQIEGFTAGIGVGPDPGATSQTWLAFVGLPATPAGARVVMGVGVDAAAKARVLHLNTTGKLRLQVNSVNADSANAHSAAVHPVMLKYDRTNSAALIYSDLEKLAGTYAAITDTVKGIGTATTASASASTFVYLVLWTGSSAEMSDANVKALLQALGWTIPWS